MICRDEKRYGALDSKLHKHLKKQPEPWGPDCFETLATGN
jgi:hypothetical protein